MPLLPNSSAVQSGAAQANPQGLADWLPNSFIDTLYDYTQFLNPKEPIASFDAGSPGGEVAVIGAGAAGMVAAYELLRAGIQPTVFETSDRIGGRHWSQHFQDRKGNELDVWAELGAMRVPLANRVFWYYAHQFGAQTGTFPDPGTVPTLVYYENTPYLWNPSESNGAPTPPPGPFQQIQSDFGAYAMSLIQAIWGPWYNNGNPPNLPELVAAWQSCLDESKDQTMFDAVRRGIPQWTTEQFNAFSALGVGSGGFGNLLFSVSQMELLRHLVNRWDYKQQLIVGWQPEGKALTPEGMNGLTKQLYAQPVARGNGRPVSLSSRHCVRFNSKVTRVEMDARTQQLRVRWTDKASRREQVKAFSAIIVATTTRAMEIDLGLELPTGKTVNVGSPDVKNAIRNFHLMGASKMFIRTKTKFWLEADGKPRPNIPQSIQTDELPRQVYCLNYPHTDEGVVLISYTWEDDSTKLLALDPVQRFEKFKEVLARICPPFAEYLIPVNGTRGILNIDWQNTQPAYGGVKIQLPGQELYLHNAYYQFLSVLDPTTDRGVYLAGDCISWAGQWTEGALQTGINAACAVAKHLGGSVRENSPLTQNPQLYRYGGPSA